MSGFFGEYLRRMLPSISSSPSGPESLAAEAENPEIDPTAAANVFRSYHHRLGRPPSLNELRAALGLETDLPEVGDYAASTEKSTGFGLIGDANAAPRLPGRTGRPARISPENFGPWSLALLKLHPLLNAQLQTSRAAWQYPLSSLSMALAGLTGEERLGQAAALELFERVDGALRAQSQAYDWWKSDPSKSYQTYFKERIDSGPCRDSEKLDPNSHCYYSGMTSGYGSPRKNIKRRFEARYPSDNYHFPKLDCTISSHMAGRAREQELINQFRRLGLSDNVANSLADDIWRPYFEEMAEQQCGHIRLP